MKNRIIKYIICLSISMSGLYSQDTRDNSTFKGNKNVISKEYNKAEINYRKALSNSEKETKASHNLGNVLFENNNYDEAIQEYFKTQKNSDIDLEKHSAFHNLGNSYMKKKDYGQAVESYKNALRNNPEDDETRYNYAIAKKFLEGDKRNKSQNNNKDSEESKEDKSEEKDENQEKENNNEEKQESKNEKPNDQKDEEEKGGGLSKQQMENLLEAINNIENDVNKKVNANKKKVKTSKKSEKDW